MSADATGGKRAWDLHLWHILAFGVKTLNREGGNVLSLRVGVTRNTAHAWRGRPAGGGGGLEELEQEGKRCE